MRDFDLWDAYIKWADGVNVCRTHALVLVAMMCASWFTPRWSNSAPSLCLSMCSTPPTIFLRIVDPPLLCHPFFSLLPRFLRFPFSFCFRPFAPH